MRSVTPAAALLADLVADMVRVEPPEGDAFHGFQLDSLGNREQLLLRARQAWQALGFVATATGGRGRMRVATGGRPMRLEDLRPILVLCLLAFPMRAYGQAHRDLPAEIASYYRDAALIFVLSRSGDPPLLSVADDASG